MPLPFSLLLAAALGLACRGGKDEPTDGGTTEPGARGDCNPIDDSLCLLPFPSSFFLEPADTATGWRVAYGPTSLPMNIDGVQTEPGYWNERDGHSINSPLLAYFEGLSGDELVPYTDIGASLAAGSTSVLIDAQTGERVPHWAEIEVTSADPGQRLLVLRTIHPLRYGGHYVVGLRGLRRTDGAPVESSAGFRALRDGTASADPDVERQRARYDEVVFPALEAAGVAREELQLAWELHTASRENTIGRARLAIEDSVARIEAGALRYEWLSREEGDCAAGEEIARTLEGRMFLPLYTEEDEPGAVLNRDALGLPFAAGEATADFLVRVPCSVAEDPAPSFLLQYGHGFFGDYSEAMTGWLRTFLDQNRMVLVATNWKGMSFEDVGPLTVTILNEPSRIAALPERSVQGMVEQNALLMLARTALSQDEALSFPDAEGNPVNVIDPERFSFYGISQGSIYGVGYFGLSPFLERAAFSVGGNPYSLMFTRSNNFGPFFSLFQAKFDDQRLIMLYTIGLMQQLWDLAEGGGYLWDLNQEVPAGYPEKHALLQTAIGDAQVTFLAAQVQARGFQARTVAPQTRAIYGIEEATAPFTGSALVEWRFTDVPEPSTEGLPPDPDTDPHDCPRRIDLAQQQLAHFIQTGEVIQTCDGVCETERALWCD